MEELYKKLKEAGEYSDDYASFKSDYGKPDAQAELHALLREKDMVSRPLDQWQKKYFSGDAVVDVDALTEKKKPEAQAGLPVAGGPSKTASPATQNSGAVDFSGAPAVTVKPQAPVETPDDDLNRLMQAPTEELLFGYVKNLYGQNGQDAAIRMEALPKEKALPLVKQLDGIRKRTDISTEQKFLDAKRAVHDSLGKEYLIGDYVENDIYKTEAAIEQSKPAEYKKILEKRLNDHFTQTGVPVQDGSNFLIRNSINDVFSDPIDIEEATLRRDKAENIQRGEKTKARIADMLKRGEISQKDAEFQLAGIGAEDKIAGTDQKILELKAQRLEGYQKKIEDLNSIIVQLPQGGDRAAFIKERDLLKKQRDGYLNPVAQVAKVMSEYGTEVNEAKGKTPMEKMESYYAELAFEYNKLKQKTVDKGAANFVVESTFGGASGMTERMNELQRRMQAIAPIVHFNEAPRGDGSSLATTGAEGFFGNLIPQVAQGVVSPAMTKQTANIKTVEALALAGIDASGLDPELMRESSRIASEHHGIGTGEFWAKTLGSTAGVMTKLYAGGKAIPVGLLGNLSKQTKTLKYLGNAFESGLNYSKAGTLLHDDELTFASGFFGGLGSGLVPSVAAKKAATDAVYATFGDRAKDAAKRIANASLKTAAAAGAEVPEELGNDLGNILMESSSYTEFAEGLRKRFPDVNSAVEFVVSTLVMGGGMKAAELAGGGGGDSDVETPSDALVNRGSQAYDDLSPEDKAVADKVLGELAKESADVAEMLKAPQGEAIDAAQSFEVGQGGAGTEAAPEARLTNKEEMLTFAKDRQDFPEAYSKGDPLTKFRLRQDMGLIGQPDPVNTLKQGADNAAVEAPATEVATEATKKAYDFDDTLFDNKTKQLTPLGEEVKARIEAGEDVTVVTARDGKDTGEIEAALGISKDKIKATGDESTKGQVLDELGIAREDYYDADQAKMAAIQGNATPATKATLTDKAKPVIDQMGDVDFDALSGLDDIEDLDAIERAMTAAQEVAVPVSESAPAADVAPAKEKAVKKRAERVKKAVEKPAVERTPTETAEVLSVPEVAPEVKQEAKIADDTRVDNIAASIEGKTPAKVNVTVDGKDQVGTVTKVSTHPKSGKEIYTVEVTDANGNRTTKDVLASMADVAEWNESAVESAKPAETKAKGGSGQKVKKSYDKWRDAYTGMMSVGVISDPKEEAKKMKAFIDATIDLGFSVIEAGFTDLAAWTGKMKELVGDKMDAILPKVYDKAKARFESEGKKAEPKEVEKPASKEAKEPRAQINAGITPRVVKSDVGTIDTTGFEKASFNADSEQDVRFTDSKGNEHGIYFNPKALEGILVSKDGSSVFLMGNGRATVLAKVGDAVIPFYRSSEGTSGKTQGQWYPFFGYAYNGWIIKGGVDSKGKMNYTPEIDAVTTALNDNFKTTGDVVISHNGKVYLGEDGVKVKTFEYKQWFDVNNLSPLDNGDRSAFNDVIGLKPSKDVYRPAEARTSGKSEAFVEQIRQNLNDWFDLVIAQTKGQSPKNTTMFPQSQAASQQLSQKSASEPKVESKEEEKKEEKKEPKPRVATDPLSTKGETRQRGLEQTLLKEGEVFGDFLTDLVKEAPNLYETIDFEEAMEVAKNRIEEEGLAALHSTLTTKGNIDPIVSAMQGLAMQMYSQMGDNARKAGDMELAAKLNEALDQIIVTAGADATARGQANGIISQFAFMAPYMDSYVKGRYDKLMAEIMKAKDKSGRTLKERATSAAKDLNKAKKDNAEGIADAVTSSKAVTNAKTDPKRQAIKASLAAAKAELSQALRAGLMSAKSGIPVGELADVVIAATKLGYWIILDGTHTLNGFVKKMKAAGLQDEDFIKGIWDSSEHTGAKLSEIAEAEMKRIAANATISGMMNPAVYSTPIAIDGNPAVRTKAQYAKDIRDAIANHLADPDGRALENVLIEDLAMAPEDAARVSEAVGDKTIEMIGGSIERAANSVKNGVAKKIDKQAKADEKAALKDAKSTVAGRLALALVDGDVTADSVAGKMAEQLGLPAQLTPEMTANLRNLAMAIRNTKEGSKIRHAAEWAFAKAASDALKHIGKDKGFFGKVFNKTNASIYTSLVYAGMLNGIPTHMKNFLSVMPAVLSLGLSGVFNVTKWARAAKRAQEYKGPLSKKEVFFFNSPAYEFLFRWKHGAKSFKQAGLEAIDVARTGKGEYRWEDEVKKSKQAFDQIVESLPVLERTKFKAIPFTGGRKWTNPYNHIFGKMVGRALSATDALTSLYYENQEVAFALVGAGLEAGMTMQQIETKMNQFFTKNNPKWQESMNEAQAEADIAERFTKNKIPESTIKAEAARLMREKVKEEFSITKEAGQALRSVAKDRIFAYKRSGIIGQLAAALGGAGRLGEKAPLIGAAIKVLMKAVVPFTNIVGNMGDALVDTLPIYGIARANGWGATAIAARLFGKSWSIPEGSKTSMMGSQRSFNDDLYVQQLSRAVSGTIAVMALALLAGDDDDDFLSFSGEVKGSADKSNKVKIFGKPIFDYRMLPELYLPIRFIQAEKQYLKQPQNKDKGWYNSSALGTAYMSSAMAIKEMSFLDGLAEFVNNISRAIQATEGAAMNAENAGKAASTIFKGFLSQHVNFALKPIPTNQAIVKNFEKAISPTQESSGSLEERMYYLIGLQSVMGNEKKIDITGNEVKALPADDIFPLSSWFGLNDAGKAVNKVSEEQGIKNTWTTNEVRTFNEPDPESGSPYTQRMLTPEEYTKASKLAGQMYTEKVLAYLAGDEKDRKYDTDKDVVYKQTDSKDMPRAQKILNGFRGYAWGAAMKELFGEQTLTQDEFNALIGQEDL